MEEFGVNLPEPFKRIPCEKQPLIRQHFLKYVDRFCIILYANEGTTITVPCAPKSF
ncbi:MAG: hypothetical protein ACXWCS_14780 [Burkholderiales bacterium]